MLTRRSQAAREAAGVRLLPGDLRWSRRGVNRVPKDQASEVSFRKEGVSFRTLPPPACRRSRAQCVAIPLVAYGVGVVAGLLGLGGGELMAPLLLAIGMLPQVCSQLGGGVGWVALQGGRQGRQRGTGGQRGGTGAGG